MYTKNYALAFGSASFPPTSHGDPPGISLESSLWDPNMMVLDPTKRC